MESSELAAKVKAVNTANAYALRLYPVLSEYFGQYVGPRGNFQRSPESR
jgi:hypothetical protein